MVDTLMIPAVDSNRLILLVKDGNSVDVKLSAVDTIAVNWMRHKESRLR